MRKSIRLAALALSAFMVATSFVGCTKKVEPPKAPSAPSSDVTTYPIKTDATLTYWGKLSSNSAQMYANFGESPLAKEVEKKTGVKVKYINPAIGQEKDQFNIMIASGDYPDIVEYAWLTQYPGGPDKAIEDKVIIKLNDYVTKSAGLQSYLKANKELDKEIKTDANSYYAYPMIRTIDEQKSFAGPMVRKDWLDDLGLALPETIDDWYTMLKAFKEKKNAKAPLILRNYSYGVDFYQAFSGAYNFAWSIPQTYYRDDNNKVQNGLLHPDMKTFVTLMNKWYKENLIDKDFPLADQKAMDAKMLNGESGASVYLKNGGLNKWNQSVVTKDPKFKLVAVKYPTLKKGDKAYSGQLDGNYSTEAAAAITIKCKNPDIAAKWLDYAYTKEGGIIYNFGIEGESFTMKNGVPVWTDFIMNNPDKIAASVIQTKYNRSNGPFPMIPAFNDAANQAPGWEKALVYAETNAAKHNLPGYLTPSAEESTQISKIKTDLQTLANEKVTKMIMGTESLDNFDKFIEQAKKVNVEKGIELYQAALDRYSKR